MAGKRLPDILRALTPLNQSKKPFALLLAAVLFGTCTLAVSWWHWWSYQYATFDLAFYVQALWLAGQGQFHGSLLDVSIMGNHAEPIVFLLAPIFKIVPHPMTLVAVQIIALASMPFTAWRITRSLDLAPPASTLLCCLTVLNPASCYVAVHEFHPEAFAAPLLLLLIEARIKQHFGWFCLWFAASIACKENIALMLVGWGVVFCYLDRKRAFDFLLRWNIAPALIAGLWVLFYGIYLGPALNGGTVEYASLYSHLGTSGSDIVAKFFTQPHRLLQALANSLGKGTLFWGLAVSFFGLPFLRPRWLLIAAPLLLQHALSSRSWDWSINYHYGAPFIPLFWMAAAEAISRFRAQTWLAFAPVFASAVLQFFIGPFRQLSSELATLDTLLWEREWKSHFVAAAADPNLSVAAGYPYQSHLAMRKNLYSLHFIVKGAGTLSNRHKEATFDPDLILADFSDTRTMGVFHPAGQIADADGAVIDPWLPASDTLIHHFLSHTPHSSESVNAFTIFRRGRHPESAIAGEGDLITANSYLTHVSLTPDKAGLALDADWRFTGPRDHFPWITLALSAGKAPPHLLELGMCAPEVTSGTVHEHRRILLPPSIPAGDYDVSALLIDEAQLLFGKDENAILKTIPLGRIRQQP